MYVKLKKELRATEYGMHIFIVNQRKEISLEKDMKRKRDLQKVS
jgi:hypothetical protein